MIQVVNPSNGELLQEIESDSKEVLQDKWLRAQEFRPEWLRVPLEKRQEAIRKFRQLLQENVEGLAKTLSLEVGKPIQQARNEILATLPRIDFFVENVALCLQETIEHEEENLSERISWEPLGSIANISAWNYPYFVGANVFVPALLTGNTVFYKPSEFATLTGLAIQSLLWQAGIPRNAFVAVMGAGGVASNMLDYPLQGVFFTGSQVTGGKIASQVAGRMKVQLELGGKDPVYVCDDVDVKTAATSLADGAFYNTGQSCCSVERIYVHEKIYQDFVDAFVEEVQTFAIGDPLEEATYIGPLARAQHIKFLEAQIADAKEKGAKVLLGGEAIVGSGNYFSPTVLTEVNSTMRVMSEESFGPLIGIEKVSSDVQAVEQMNNCRYGLTSGVFSPDKDRASKILQQIESGTVYWNCCDRVSPNLPWSGRRGSGLGVTLGKIGIQTFLQPKAWHLRSS
ncbi:MAG: aldehyde dehydrogenase family protein [Spirochaetota bacterium]